MVEVPRMPRLEHIGLDVDGVLRDLATHLVQVFEREFPHLKGRHMPIDRWPEWWGFERYFPPEIEFFRFAKQFLPEIMRDAGAYPGIAEFLTRLAAERTVHIVTSQPSVMSETLTREWLQVNGVPVPPERVHITSTKEQAPI